jgi:hypothetical protein
MREPQQIPDIITDLCSYNPISCWDMEQWIMGMSLPDAWLGETGEVIPAVAQLRGVADMAHPVINQRILVGGGADDGS